MKQYKNYDEKSKQVCLSNKLFKLSRHVVLTQ